MPSCSRRSRDCHAMRLSFFGFYEYAPLITKFQQWPLTPMWQTCHVHVRRHDINTSEESDFVFTLYIVSQLFHIIKNLRWGYECSWYNSENPAGMIYKLKSGRDSSMRPQCDVLSEGPTVCARWENVWTHLPWTSTWFFLHTLPIRSYMTKSPDCLQHVYTLVKNPPKLYGWGRGFSQIPRNEVCDKWWTYKSSMVYARCNGSKRPYYHQPHCSARCSKMVWRV